MYLGSWLAVRESMDAKTSTPGQQSSRQSVSIEQQGQARFESFSEVALFPETLGGVSTLALVPDLPRPLGNHG